MSKCTPLFALVLFGISLTLQAQSATWEARSGRHELYLLWQHYPSVDEVRYIDNDWAIRIDDTWFFWANARLLPQEERENWRQYQSIRFYRYYRGPLVARTLTNSQVALLRERLESPSFRVSRHNGFLDALYGISNAQEAENRMQKVQFLGHSVRVHPFLVEPLTTASVRIIRVAQQDPELASFISNIHSVSGYVWRNISGSQSRSYHSYGIAVDILSSSYQNKHTYWLWSRQQGIEEWWDIPIENRWTLPQKIIDIMEDIGFIWGGKWLFFDPVHFEYRPELLSENE